MKSAVATPTQNVIESSSVQGESHHTPVDTSNSAFLELHSAAGKAATSLKTAQSSSEKPNSLLQSKKSSSSTKKQSLGQIVMSESGDGGDARGDDETSTPSNFE